jgi:hypothetical protein
MLRIASRAIKYASICLSVMNCLAVVRLDAPQFRRSPPERGELNGEDMSNSFLQVRLVCSARAFTAQIYDKAKKIQVGCVS